MSTQPQTTSLRIENAGPIRKILLDRPSKKNALTRAMYIELAAALQDAQKAPDVVVVVLGSTSEAFSAGNDLADFLEETQAIEDAPVMAFLKTLIAFPKLLVAAVDGFAVGVGTTMLLHCDIVIASDRALFQLPFVQLALVPEAASTVLLPALVGLRRASQWLLLGERFDAPTALDAGLVNAVVPPAELMPTALARATALAKLPQHAARETKRLIRAPWHASTQEALLREAKVFSQQMQSAEAKAAFTALLSRGK